MIKQKLSKRHTRQGNTSTDTSLVRGDCDHGLNIPQGKASAHDEKTFDNTSEVNQQQSHRAGSKVSDIVYVLSMNGEPLMPTKPRKARILLKEGKATVIQRKPFTIKLNYETTNFKQDVVLGVDPGYRYLGLSAVTGKKEVYAAEVTLRTDMSGLISERLMYRKLKRRKLWYRNRKTNRNRKKGWLAPSIVHKIDTTARMVGRVCEILPISKIIVEKAKFDIQKIMNPEIKGKEYQEGPCKGFDNVNKYVLHRDNHTCQHCGKNKDVKFEVHHIETRKTGGNRQENLLTLCGQCHRDFHDGKIKLKFDKKKGYKETAFMNIARHRIVNEIEKNHDNVGVTYGYVTDAIRREFTIEKSHVNDAFCIAGGTTQERRNVLYYSQKRRNNRSIQKNIKGHKSPSIRKKRYKLQPKDLIRLNKKLYLVCGVNGYGKGVYLDDEIKRKQKDKKYASTKLVEIVKYASGMYLKL
jgi:N6-L-threonylcarbamoyladenine synthase